MQDAISPRQLIRDLIARKPVPRCGFWLGNPHPDALPLYLSYFRVPALEDLHLKLGSDIRWISPQFIPSTYLASPGEGFFDIRRDKRSLGASGPLASCRTESDLDGYEWPSVEDLDFSETLDRLRNAGPFYRASGFWAPFFHDVMDLFGIEEFMINLHERPAIVHAALDRICGFYYEANEKFFDLAGDLVDGSFTGNDFGTQRDLMISPEQLEEFIFPWFRRFTAQAKRRGYQVLLHSCGSVHRVVGTLIAAGVECLHPLQALAGNMDAVTLARDFRGRIAFLGGIDTQDLLVHGSPDEVRREVKRVMSLLGPHYIVSPSHEALLPNVSPENLSAMADAARVWSPGD